MIYSKRNILLILIDAILIMLAMGISLLLRFDNNIPGQYWNAFKTLAPFITLVTISCFIGLKLYRRIWQYASIGEMLMIFRGTTIAMGLVVTAIYLTPLPRLPRSVYILIWVFMNVFIGSSRLGWRLVRKSFTLSKDQTQPQKNLLIVGAGDAGSLLVREINNNPQLAFKIVGLVDDEPSKHHTILHGVPVLGKTAAIPYLVTDLDIDEIIVAIPSAPGEVIRPIVEKCQATTARVKILPGFYPGAQGTLMSSIREVRMEDLLRRKPVSTDIQGVSAYISGHSVLVTGAGGSIGSELCRQILSFNPARLIMVDNCENNLFDIEGELKTGDHAENIIPQLIDVKDKEKLARPFKTYKPEIVFHAAAYKHVPMMERHPDEAISNNVIGTRNVAELADKYGSRIFIQVSTDKAVNPTSVMGASKRIAELVIKDMNTRSNTIFAAVRFGNVLGSRGSVIPTFIKQIKKGGPLTVTDPEMRRYFMTIPEAVQLIIQAGALAEGGEVFVLDMGEMVKIDDLARDLIRLSGYEPDKDIEIIYTGMRPGEKLYEELFTDKESMLSTHHERIFISKKELDDNYVDISKSLHLMFKRETKDRREILAVIKQIVPEYQGGGTEKSATG